MTALEFSARVIIFDSELLVCFRAATLKLSQVGLDYLPPLGLDMLATTARFPEYGLFGQRIVAI